MNNKQGNDPAYDINVITHINTVDEAAEFIRFIIRSYNDNKILEESETFSDIFISLSHFIYLSSLEGTDMYENLLEEQLEDAHAMVFPYLMETVETYSTSRKN